MDPANPQSNTDNLQSPSLGSPVPSAPPPVTPVDSLVTPAPVSAPPSVLTPQPTPEADLPKPTFMEPQAAPPVVPTPPSDGGPKSSMLVKVSLIVLIAVLVFALGYIAYAKFVNPVTTPTPAPQLEEEMPVEDYTVPEETVTEENPDLMQETVPAEGETTGTDTGLETPTEEAATPTPESAY